MTKTLTIAAIMGLGEPPDDPTLHGLRDFLESQVAKAPLQLGFLVYSHADPELHDKILALPGDIILAGHSNGGDEESENLDPMFYGAGREIFAELMMDAKPEWHNIGDVIDWLNPWYQYPPPVSTIRYQAFYGKFGCPYYKLENSTKLDIPHADFPGAPECHEWLGARVDEWLALNPPEQTV